MKTIVVIFSIVMLFCISGMIYYSGNDRVFSLFSTTSVCITLFGTYVITRKQGKESSD